MFPDTPKTLLKKIAELAQGDDRAEWEAFVELYEPPLMRFIRLKSPALSTADVEDVVQDVFVRLVSVLREGRIDRTKAKFRAYLASMTRRILIDRYRAAQVRPRLAAKCLSEQKSSNCESADFVDAIVSIASKRNETSPSRRDWDNRIHDSHPGSVPSAMGSVPSVMGSVPSAMGSVPADVGSVPADVGSVPADMGSVPSAMGSVPADVGSVPSVMGSVPADVGSVPSAMGSVLSAMGSVPSDAIDPGAAVDILWRIAAHEAAKDHVFTKTAISDRSKRIYEQLERGLSPREVAAQEGVSYDVVKQVKSRIDRAIAAIEKRIG